MSFVLQHLRSGWHVDQAILSEEDRLVVIRFGRDSDPDCMRQDEVLYRIAERVKNFAVVYVCDLDEVPDFKSMYEVSCGAGVYISTHDSKKLTCLPTVVRSHDNYVLL